MRRAAVIMTFLLAAALQGCHTQAATAPEPPLNYITTAEDSVLAVSIMQSLDKDKSTARLMVEAGRKLLGQPYVAGTLDEQQFETTCIYLTRTDCILFVETCLNLARTAHSGSSSFTDLARNIQQTRYRNSAASDYNERLHYTTEWIRRNEARGIMRDMTMECSGKVYDHPVSFMTAHPDLYPLMDRDSILAVEQELNSTPYTYIPKADASAALSHMQPGDIICYVTSTAGLDIQHVALYIGEGKFMHASTSSNKVVIEERSLGQYMAASKSIAGFKVVRPL